MSDTDTTTSAALRQAADLLDAHPDLPQPYISTLSGGTAHVAWYLSVDFSDQAQQKVTAASIIRALGGKWDKAEVGEDFAFTRRADLLHLRVQVDRPAVCERVVVGTEQRTIPAVDAQPERVEVVEQVEWRCQPLLADADDPAATHDADGSPMETYENDGVPA